MALNLTKKAAKNTFLYARRLVEFAHEGSLCGLHLCKDLNFSFLDLRQKIVAFDLEQPILLIDFSLIVKIKLFKVLAQTSLRRLSNSIDVLCVCVVNVGFTAALVHLACFSRLIWQVLDLVVLLLIVVLVFTGGIMPVLFFIVLVTGGCHLLN